MNDMGMEGDCLMEENRKGDPMGFMGWAGEKGREGKIHK